MGIKNRAGLISSGGDRGFNLGGGGFGSSPWEDPVTYLNVAEIVSDLSPYAFYISTIGVLDSGGSSCDDAEAVTTWNDQSGNAKHMEQSSASKKPTYRANVIGGPSLQFDGGDYVIANVSGDVPSGESGYFCVAGRYGSILDVLVAFANDAVATRYLHVGSGATNLIWCVQRNADTTDDLVATGATFSSGVNFLVEVWSDSSKTYASMNGGSSIEMSVTLGANNGDWSADVDSIVNFTIGALVHSSETAYWASHISSVLYVDGSVPTDTQRAKLRRFLNLELGMGLAIA